MRSENLSKICKEKSILEDVSVDERISGNETNLTVADRKDENQIGRNLAKESSGQILNAGMNILIVQKQGICRV